VCERAGSREVEGLRATSLTTLVQMVGNGIGSTLLPRSAADVLLKGGDVVGIPFRSQAPGRTVGLAWRKGSSRSALFGALATIFAEAGRKLLG